MKASELKNYKALDITKISGTPWNTAEKVLGLDENDKVVMAETDESVSPEYVENAISEAMEAETSRTESTYAKKSEVTGYTTTEEVNQAISTATGDGAPTAVVAAPGPVGPVREESDDDRIFEVVEENAQFPGGDEASFCRNRDVCPAGAGGAWLPPGGGPACSAACAGGPWPRRDT